MAESNQHRALVARLEKFAILLKDNFPYLVVSLDLPGSKWLRPAKIEGCVPDMLAQTVPRSLTVVGEAKSELDLETERSLEQLRGYLRYLSYAESPTMVLSVPWTVSATARAVFNCAKSEVKGSDCVNLVILDGVNSERSMVTKLCH